MDLETNEAFKSAKLTYAINYVHFCVYCIWNLILVVGIFNQFLLRNLHGQYWSPFYLTGYYS